MDNLEIDSCATLSKCGTTYNMINLFHYNSLAFAVWYNIDYLITWNCKHIANAMNIKKINNYNIINKLWMPVFCTPQELMEV
jgi:hypothetical protein